jgi:hypothetical protein
MHRTQKGNQSKGGRRMSEKRVVGISTEETLRRNEVKKGE